MTPTNIVYNERVQGLSHAVHERESTFLHRAWNLISSLGGVAPTFSSEFLA
jgi:hypothetical protein